MRESRVFGPIIVAARGIHIGFVVGFMKWILGNRFSSSKPFATTKERKGQKQCEGFHFIHYDSSAVDRTIIALVVGIGERLCSDVVLRSVL